MEYDKMSIEELREVVLKRDKELLKMKESNKIFEETLKSRDEEINSYLNDIKELKLKNYDLFIQIPKVNEVVKEDKPVEEQALNLNDITNNLIEGME